VALLSRSRSNATYHSHLHSRHALKVHRHGAVQTIRLYGARPSPIPPGPPHSRHAGHKSHALGSKITPSDTTQHRRWRFMRFLPFQTLQLGSSRHRRISLVEIGRKPHHHKSNMIPAPRRFPNMKSPLNCAAYKNEVKWPSSKLLVIGVGTGRCGTQALAQLFQANGMLVTHEGDFGMGPLSWDAHPTGCEGVVRRLQRLRDETGMVTLPRVNRSSLPPFVVMNGPTSVVGDVWSAHLPYLEAYFSLIPEGQLKVVALKRDRDTVVEALLRSTPRWNPWQPYKCCQAPDESNTDFKDLTLVRALRRRGGINSYLETSEIPKHGEPLNSNIWHTFKKGGRGRGKERQGGRERGAAGGGDVAPAMATGDDDLRRWVALPHGCECLTLTYYDLTFPHYPPSVNKTEAVGRYYDDYYNWLEAIRKRHSGYLHLFSSPEVFAVPVKQAEIFSFLGFTWTERQYVDIHDIDRPASKRRVKGIKPVMVAHNILTD